MGLITVYLCLGSNLGDRAANLRQGIERLQTKVHISTTSPIYQTKPWGYADQPDFLNCVCEGETELSPGLLLSFVKDVEEAVGRKPTFVYGPRVLDVDILFYGDRVISEEGLEVPHPRLAERAFVLVPLADIAPELRHPVLGGTMAELLARLDKGRGESGVRRWGFVDTPSGR